MTVQGEGGLRRARGTPSQGMVAPVLLKGQRRVPLALVRAAMPCDGAFERAKQAVRPTYTVNL